MRLLSFVFILSAGSKCLLRKYITENAKTYSKVPDLKFFERFFNLASAYDLATQMNQKTGLVSAVLVICLSHVIDLLTKLRGWPDCL